MTRRGRFAVTGSADGTARVWDLFAGSGHVQQSHNGRVSGLIASGDTAVTYGVPFGLQTGSPWVCVAKFFLGHAKLCRDPVKHAGYACGADALVPAAVLASSRELP